MRLSTITLIGMPGAGKSSVGVLLAKQVGLNFVDSDLLIQVRESATLQQILNQAGHQRLRQLEQDVLLDMPLDQSLIATGGSAVYSDSGMQRLHAAGPVVYISVELETLQQRVDNENERGIAKSPGQSFADVYAERLPLYQQHADLVIDGGGQSAEATARLIALELGY
ncbi:MAG: shikimate kinase [Halieaceae bacterium]